MPECKEGCYCELCAEEHRADGCNCERCFFDRALPDYDLIMKDREVMKDHEAR